VDFKPGDVVQYALNENFRDPTKPYFKTVTFKGGGDAATAARAVFQNGEVDYAWNLQVPSSVLQPIIASSTKATLVTAYSSSTERIVINFADPDPHLGDLRSEPSTKHPFFSDPIVRKALALATDRKIVAQQLYGDGITGKPGCNIVTGIPAYESTATASFCNTLDVVAAAKLLDDDGWKLGPDGVRSKNGVALRAIFQTTVSDVRQKTQEVLKAGWEKAGFRIELKAVPAGVFFTNTSPDGANHFWADLEMFTSLHQPDPTNYLAGYTSTQATGKANNWNSSNYNRYQNPQFDALIDQLRSTTDPAKRATIIKQANDILILDVVVIPIVWRTQITSGVSNALKGVVASGWDSEMWDVADWSK
jgi:peptide/nickel transport system substrate-binding protein